MPKRHNHAKKSQHRKPSAKSAKNVNHSKGVKKNDAKIRVKRTKNVRARTKGSLERVKPVPKGAKIYKRGTVRPLGRNDAAKSSTKRDRKTSTDTKRISKAGKVQKRIHKTNGKGTRKSQPKRTNKVTKHIPKRIVKKVKGLLEDAKSNRKLKITKTIRKDQDGKPIPQNNVKGFRTIYNIELPKGDFQKTIEYVCNADFKFLLPALNRNKPIKGAGAKEPRAVFIKIRLTYKGKNYFRGAMSEPDFIVRLTNIKQLTLERLIEYQDNWLERSEENEDYLSESGKTYNPKNITGISYEFIY